MTIDWQQFAPLNALSGGVLIGIASATLLLFTGRIAGISGIVGGLLAPRRGETDWRIAFVCGLMAAPLLWGLFASLPESRIDTGWPLLIAAGLLVGYGTRMGSGCTSGHGVCGLSRLSTRSLVATTTFMAAGFATTFILRHVLGG